MDAGAGEADVALAIRDALATFPADEIVVAVSRDDEDVRDAITSGSETPAGARRIRGSSPPLRGGRRLMTSSQRETRAAENEDLFRRLNERLHTLATVASSSVLEADTPERFLCECSQTSCSRVLELTPSEYRSVRETNRRFLVFPDPSHTDPTPRDRRRAARELLGRGEERRGRRRGREPRRGNANLSRSEVSCTTRARKTGIHDVDLNPHRTHRSRERASSTAGRSSGWPAPGSWPAASSTGSSASWR